MSDKEIINNAENWLKDISKITPKSSHKEHFESRVKILSGLIRVARRKANG